MYQIFYVIGSMDDELLATPHSGDVSSGESGDSMSHSGTELPAHYMNRASHASGGAVRAVELGGARRSWSATPETATCTHVCVRGNMPSPRFIR